MFIVIMPSNVSATSVITRVHDPDRATSTTSPLTVELAHTPADGNVLIAVIGMRYASVPSISVSQADVDWIPLATQSYTNNLGCVYIFAGIVRSATASTTITITATGVSGITADVCEYSGLNTAFIENIGADQAKGSAGRSTTTDTTATATTSYAHELWIAGISGNVATQTTPTNGFSLIDGVASSTLSVAYLEKIVSSSGIAQTGTSMATMQYYAAVIVAIPAIPEITLVPTACLTTQLPYTVTMTGTGFAVSSPMTATFEGSLTTLYGTTTTDANGAFTVTFVVSAGTPIGTYDVVAWDNQLIEAEPEQFTVASVPPDPVPESPIGIIAPFVAIALAFGVFATVKRSKSPAKTIFQL